jgi:TetR/AcrR family transcriptional repressor of nem operon
MRYTEGHKDETHQRILDVAGTLFRKKGITAVGLATIMKEAGLTNGAFYAHFKSKEVLVKEVLGDILDKRDDQILAAIKNGASLEHLILEYLSPFHRDHIDSGCPASALITELVHHSKATRNLFTEKTERMFQRISEQLKGERTRGKNISLSVYSLMVGAIQLSRAVTDKSLSDQILKAASETAISLISVKLN